jgi:hypothetical protein
MANEILEKHGTPIVVADIAGDFGDSPIAGTDQITLASLAAGAARQSDKIDLSTPRASRYDVTGRPEFDVAPNEGDVVSFWWAPSPAAVAATANPGGVSGSDAAYTGTAGSTLAESILQLQKIGDLIVTGDAAIIVQQQSWKFWPIERYGSLVVFNETTQAFEGDDIEMSIIFNPVIDEVQ